MYLKPSGNVRFFSSSPCMTVSANNRLIYKRGSSEMSHTLLKKSPAGLNTMLSDIFTLFKATTGGYLALEFPFAGDVELFETVPIRQPFQQKNLCWDGCTFGRVQLSMLLPTETMLDPKFCCRARIWAPFISQYPSKNHILGIWNHFPHPYTTMAQMMMMNQGIAAL